MKVTYIAEIGNNHNGDINIAKKMIDAAVDSKADYVKFQIYNVDKFLKQSNPYYSDFVKEMLSFDDFNDLKKYTESQGGKFLATPFDEDSLNLLDEMGLHIVKVASGDMNNRQLLLQAISLNKELIISVGGATLDEIDGMIKFINEHNAKYSILHCIINYPAKFEELNLNFINTLKTRYSCPVGFSDHSAGIEASLAAIALGGTIIEKHFTTDRTLPGGDNEMSILPDEFKRLKHEGNNIAIALGDSDKRPSDAEKRIKKLIRRKFAAKRDISKGSEISDQDLMLLRVEEANEGFGAEWYDYLVGKKTSSDISQYDLIKEAHIS